MCHVIGYIYKQILKNSWPIVMAEVSLIHYFVSRCSVCFLKRGQYFINSIRSGLLRLSFFVIYFYRLSQCKQVLLVHALFVPSKLSLNNLLFPTLSYQIHSFMAIVM